MLQEMEKELENLKKKNVHESVINTREKQIVQIIDAMNTAEDIIGVLMISIKTTNLEMHILENQLAKAMSGSEDKQKAFFSADQTMALFKEVIGDIRRAQEQ